MQKAQVDADLSYVMENGSPFNDLHPVGREVESLGKFETVAGNPLRMAPGVAIACFYRGNKGMDGIHVDLLLFVIKLCVLYCDSGLSGNGVEQFELFAVEDGIVHFVDNGYGSDYLLFYQQRCADKGLPLVAHGAIFVKLRGSADIRNKE